MRRNKAIVNKKVAYSEIVEVCLSGLQLIRNIHQLLQPQDSTHTSGRKSSTTGRCGPWKHCLSLSVHVAFTPLLGYPFASESARGFPEYCLYAVLYDCPVWLHHASRWWRHFVICLCSFCCCDNFLFPIFGAAIVRSLCFLIGVYVLGCWGIRCWYTAWGHQTQFAWISIDPEPVQVLLICLKKHLPNLCWRIYVFHLLEHRYDVILPLFHIRYVGEWALIILWLLHGCWGEDLSQKILCASIRYLMNSDVFWRYALVGLTIAAFISRLISISCASSKATQWHLTPLMLTAKAPSSRHIKNLFWKILYIS